MKFEANKIYHVYNRGNNKQPIFFEDANYLLFIKKMRRHLIPDAKIMAYCLMPNHFHWMLFTNSGQFNAPEDSCLNLHIGTLLSSYAKAMNKRYSRTGSLFQQRTKAVAIESQEYALICYHYIHQNPLKAGIIQSMGDWPYTSYPDYCGERNGSLIAKYFTLDMLQIKSDDFSKTSSQAIDPEKIKMLFED